MIRIRHSSKPYQELEMEGSNSEFSELRSAILSFCESAEPMSMVSAQPDFDPSPYEAKLSRLCLCKTEDLLLISVVEDKLLISGKPKFLRPFAENLPCEAQHTSMRRHVHFEGFGREEQVSEASLNLVLALRR
jgi:hypothetical protein